MSGIVLLAIDTDKCRELVSAAVLHKQMPDILVPFEQDLLWELSQRALKDEAPTCTADEWRIVEDCLRDLRAALRRHQTAMEGIRLILVEKVPAGERLSDLCSP